MSAVIGLVLPFFGLILTGWLLARIVRQPAEALGWMNTFVLYVALPALFFQLLAKTPFEQLSQWTFVVGSVISTYLVFSITFAAARLIEHASLGESTIKGLAASYGNIGYMGPGLAVLAFGPQAAVPVALIFCFENIVHFTVAPLMMALAGNERTSPLQLAGKVLRRIVLHPFIVATALGVLAAYLQLRPPASVERFLDYLSGAAAPCALFALGVTLALRPLKRVPNDLAPIVLLKLVVHPALCYVILSWIGNFPPTWIFAAVLLASLPTATNVFVIAQQYHVWIERSSATILITTVASVATVTGVLYMMHGGLLPPDLFP